MPDGVFPDITVIDGDQRWSENKDILIRGETPFMKTWFFEAVKRSTKFYDNETEFKNAAFEGNSAAYDLDNCESIKGRMKEDLSQDLDKLYNEFWEAYKLPDPK